MRSIVSWAVKNSPGINVIVIGTLITGLISFMMLRRELFPEFELEVVLVTVPYPGASPSDVEKGVCQPVEEAVRALDGVKRIISIARESGGYTMLELNSNVRNVQKVVSEVRSRVDTITNFPVLAERPTVEQITFRDTAIRLAVIGPETGDPEAELKLRDVAETVRDELLTLGSISQANIQGAKKYQIDVNMSEDTLRQYGLSLSTVAQNIRARNHEMPGGQLKADGQEILLRGKNRRELGEEIRELPLITQENGVVLTVGDLGTVDDEFEDTSVVNEVNGKPAMVIAIDRTADEDLLNIASEVHAYAKQAELPPGYSLRVWGDTSVDVADRMRMLRDNGIQGLLLVFILLALFLEFRLAFWVALGIPISVFGAGIILLATGQTLNMLSMFAFLMALGIVVDDAIVVGENVYTHRSQGKSFVQSAIDGTVEVLPSVIASVTTTIIAFLPFFFVSGVMGKFIAVMPVAIIAMLLISVVEAATALGCHLAHGDPNEKPKNLPAYLISVCARKAKPITDFLDGISHRCQRGMDWVGDRLYTPSLRFLLTYPLLGIAIAFSMLTITIAFVKAGYIPFVPFPKSDSNVIVAQIVYPDGTPERIADAATKRMEEAIRKISEEVYEKRRVEEGEEAVALMRGSDDSPKGPVKLTYRQVGSLMAQGPMRQTGGGSGGHVGQVLVELHDSSIRATPSADLLNMWRKAAGDFPGAERVTFDSENMGPGGNPIEFKLLAQSKYQDELQAAVEDAKKELANYSGVYDIRDDSTPGKTEFQYRIKDSAKSMGITDDMLAETIRNTYYGAEVMRLQRGRHEVKLMVRYPEDERTSLARFNEIRIRGTDGVERPITEVIDLTVTQGYSEINRLDQKRSITVSSAFDINEGNAQVVIDKLRTEFLPKIFKEKYPHVSVNWEGEQKQTMESLMSLGIGCALAILAMYVLLVIEFQSYYQPLLILAIVPFGVIGALWGHSLMGMQVTLFSFFGLVALTGVVVNDSIVLVDFINAKIRETGNSMEALLEAGRRRMRPVFLTSVTTIGGLLPMLLETSFQAQFLVPMATSIAFGLMLSTFLVLFQVPVFYQAYLIIARAAGFDTAHDIADHAHLKDQSSAQTELLHG